MMEAAFDVVDMSLRLSFFLFLVFAYACRGDKHSSEESEGRGIGIRDVLPIKTIANGEGDTVDCIDIYVQPAFGHPALEGHAVRLMPSSLISRDVGPASNVSYKLAEPCPPGSVPIPRFCKVDPLIVRTLSTIESENRTCDGSNLNEIVDFSRIFWADGENPIEHGGGAVLSTHNLTVAKERFTSLNLVVQGGTDGRLSAISAGWMVDQKGTTRLFTSWTGDDHNGVCYNHDCPGFVQTSSDLALNAVVTHKGDGDLSGIQVSVLQDPLTRHWWLAYDGNFVGYWPNELFGDLYDGATLLDWSAATKHSTFYAGT
ncbi:hypothetical protein MLD38_013639 [Melastoma candidum]|uniref:Uncharacterized protein n=1 Tax=Melastoma candidum TaxID=119954 RepID=A0ACB9RAU5_9MYRT|nr:hypothetical protein MLD38_013639 [Melastoma candidum]